MHRPTLLFHTHAILISACRVAAACGNQNGWLHRGQVVLAEVLNQWTNPNRHTNITCRSLQRRAACEITSNILQSSKPAGQQARPGLECAASWPLWWSTPRYTCYTEYFRQRLHCRRPLDYAAVGKAALVLVLQLGL